MTVVKFIELCFGFPYPFEEYTGFNYKLLTQLLKMLMVTYDNFLCLRETKEGLFVLGLLEH